MPSALKMKALLPVKLIARKLKFLWKRKKIEVLWDVSRPIRNAIVHNFKFSTALIMINKYIDNKLKDLIIYW